MLWHGRRRTRTTYTVCAANEVQCKHTEKDNAEQIKAKEGKKTTVSVKTRWQQSSTAESSIWMEQQKLGRTDRTQENKNVQGVVYGLEHTPCSRETRGRGGALQASFFCSCCSIAFSSSFSSAGSSIFISFISFTGVTWREETGRVAFGVEGAEEAAVAAEEESTETCSEAEAVTLEAPSAEERAGDGLRADPTCVLVALALLCGVPAGALREEAGFCCAGLAGRDAAEAMDAHDRTGGLGRGWGWDG